MIRDGHVRCSQRVLHVAWLLVSHVACGDNCAAPGPCGGAGPGNRYRVTVNQLQDSSGGSCSAADGLGVGSVFVLTILAENQTLREPGHFDFGCTKVGCRSHRAEAEFDDSVAELSPSASFSSSRGGPWVVGDANLAGCAVTMELLVDMGQSTIFRRLAARDGGVCSTGPIGRNCSDTFTAAIESLVE